MLKMQKTAIKRLGIRVLTCIADAFIVWLAAFVSYLMLVWGSEFTVNNAVIVWSLINGVAAVVVFALFGVYSREFSAVGLTDAVRLCAATVTLGVINFLVILILNLSVDGFTAHHLTYGVICVFTVFMTLWIGVFRFSKRTLFAIHKYLSGFRTEKRRVMIVGFNNDAFALIRNMTSNKKSVFKPVCMLDENEQYLGEQVCGVCVVGLTRDAKIHVRRYRVQEIFLTIPSTKKAMLKEALHYCKECGCKIKLLPELNQIAGGELSVAKLRSVDVADLLGREVKSVNLDEIMDYIEQKTVLVTGGGGSIGSELCRQIASHNPKQLIVLDIYENNAYDIEQELRTKYPKLNLLTLIASIREQGKVRDVFDKYRPQIVFNAAAHKHVPLMETSPNEAVKNNVFGTLNVARAADEFRVETFVQISTDKAVNPTNIMGATKRICEMIIQTIGRHSEYTKFVAVRFGNVLGSNGSVIPLFKKQIDNGGPVTVTHKDIIRYFMTIPEAVSLVLQAGAYAKSGQIFVLDMGEPVKIYDLAYNLIKLSGLEPGVDIEIKCTGLRPGEKLYEERLMAEEGLQQTPNGQISIAKPLAIDEENFWNSLDSLYEAAYSETDRMKEWVKRLVPTYTIDKHGEAVKTYFGDKAEEKKDAEVAAAN